MHLKSNAALTFSNVSKSYITGNYFRGKREVKALQDVNCSLAKSQILGVVGVNGAGKSTFVKLACGILKPSSGHVDVLGVNPARDRKNFLSKIGLVMGARSRLIWDLPVLHSFFLQKEIYGVSDRELSIPLMN